MKNGITELVFILDMSGSMHGLEEDTIGGFNSLICEHAADEGKTYVTTYLFNSEKRMIHDRLPINEVGKMTDRDYRTGGSTALLDAMGDAIHHIAEIHRYGRKEDVPEHTIFIITTDGMENSSTRYTADKVREMVSHEKEKYGWEFIYLAANIDAVETAKEYGIDMSRAVNYCHDSVGTANLYRAAGKALSKMQRHESLAEDDWRAEIDIDYKKRGK